MAITAERIEAVAPDQASLAAAVKIKPSSWVLLGRDAAGEFAWGECQGSGSAPYRACVQTGDLGAKCTCPSRKFPCKHALALMLALAKTPERFTAGQVPDWVMEWSGRRRFPSPMPRAERSSLAEALEESEPDEKSEARAAAARERLKAQREEAIRAGLDELDLWIGDQLSRGLASFMGQAVQSCRAMAQRLTDAKAPGLAQWADALPGRILALPEAQRHAALLSQLGTLHLFAEAYRKQDVLPDALRHDVRRIAGWTIERLALLDMPEARRVTADWLVTGTVSEIQPDKLRRIETWLSGSTADGAVSAVLIDYVPAASGAAGSAYIPGEMFRAEFVFYPSAVPLRAVLAQRFEEPASAVRAVPETLSAALDHYLEQLALLPWLGSWPMTIRDVRIAEDRGQSLWLSDGAEGLPLAPQSRDEALVLTGVAVQSITGLWDGQYFSPLMAETALGRWVRS